MNAAAPMNTIWIVCPTTGERISTSIETDAVSFGALPSRMLTLVCPACGEIHPWAEMGGHLVVQPLKAN
jgi:hypothetical protein